MADCGIASRRKCEEYIAAGRVTVNGIVAKIGESVDEEKDIVMLDDVRVDNTQNSKKVVIMLNKPRGVVSSCSDPLFLLLT